MSANESEARHQLQQAERHLVEAERAIQDAVGGLGNPLRDAVQDAQIDAQMLIRRIGRFLSHLRRAA